MSCLCTAAVKRPKLLLCWTAPHCTTFKLCCVTCLLVQSPSCYVSNLGSYDVHYSSGVANHFFYLVAEGSAPNNGLPSSPLCNNVAGPLAGIGRDKAGAIWYRALTVYMTSLTNYAGKELSP